jgi:hypothetical protein
MSFFECLAHRLGADRIDQSQDDQFVGQQVQGPATPPPGRIATSQLDQLSFDIPPNLDLARPGRLRPGVECPCEPLGDQALADSTDGADADPQSGDDLVIGVLIPSRGVRQQEDPSVCELPGSGFTDRDQVLQLGPFLQRQGNSILLHGRAPSLRE